MRPSSGSYRQMDKTKPQLPYILWGYSSVTFWTCVLRAKQGRLWNCNTSVAPGERC